MEDKLFFPLICRGLSEKIQLSSITYITQEMKYIVVVTDNNTTSIRAKMEICNSYLNEYFYQCHSYLIINLEKVIRMSGDSIFFENGKSIKMGKNNFLKTKKAYDNYLKNL